MQSVRRFFTTKAQKIIEEIPVPPRLESHYFNTLYEDLMIMNYDHFSPALNELKNDKVWNFQFTDNHREFIQTLNLNELPTKPFEKTTFNLLTTLNEPRNEKVKLKKKLKNPIDYTPIKKEDFYRRPAEQSALPFSPSPMRVPSIQEIELEITCEDAVSNK
jgi:hypothetical protein